MKALVSPWLERYAALMLWLSAVFSLAHEAWGSAAICAGSAAVVSALALFRWVKER